MGVRAMDLVRGGVPPLVALTVAGCFGAWGGATGTDAGTGTSTSSASTATMSSDGSSSTSQGASTTGLPTTGSSTLATTSTAGSTGNTALTCEHLDVLFVVDVSESMGPYAPGLQSLFVALGAGEGSVLGEVDDYHIGVTLNAPPTLNESAVGVPEGQTCTGLGSLVRGNTDCVDGLSGRPYISTEDNLILGLGCLVAPFTETILPPIYEGRRTLDSLEATLLSDSDDALSVCNAGFHQPGDPLLVVLVIDDEDASRSAPGSYLPTLIGSQGGDSLRNVGVLVVGADTASCGGGGEDGGDETTGGPTCDAVPSCRVRTLLDQAFVGLDGHVATTDLCRAQSDDPATLAAEVRAQLSALYAKICAPEM